MKYLCAADLAAYLGVSIRRVRTWIRNGLPHKRPTGYRYQIKTEDAKEWLIENRHYAKGIERGNLVGLFGEAAADIICTAKHIHHGRPKPVMRLDNYEVYPSVRQAAAAAHLKHPTIVRALKLGIEAGGIRWRYLE